LITAPVGTTLEDAVHILQEHRIEKLPLVDEVGVLKGLITVKDIMKKRDYPLRSTDARGRLLCGAAIGVGDAAMSRVEAMAAQGLDLVVIDSAHGHADSVLETTRRVKAAYPLLALVAGNVVTAAGTRDLISAGADVVKVGVGAGSICTTRVVTGVGMPQFTAIQACAAEAHRHGVTVIADGGIKYSGDIVKALAAGADAVMLGGLLAGLKESPGELIIYEGRRFKEYRGMGSLGAMKGLARDRYGSGQVGGKHVPEGIEGQVPYKGELANYVLQLMGGLRSGMGYIGAHDLAELGEKAQFVRISNAGLVESHPHSIFVTKEAPNYPMSPQ
jgi:IMP dehydrogenase